jgi:hypothetical protein
MVEVNKTELSIQNEAKLSDLVDMLKSTHAYVTNKYLFLKGITFVFVEDVTGETKKITLGVESGNI